MTEGTEGEGMGGEGHLQGCWQANTDPADERKQAGASNSPHRPIVPWSLPSVNWIFLSLVSSLRVKNSSLFPEGCLLFRILKLEQSSLGQAWVPDLP